MLQPLVALRSFQKLQQTNFRSLLATLACDEYSGSENAQVDEGAHTAIVVHGFLGQGKNWRTFCRKVVTEATQHTQKPWKVLTVDMRCHGRSSQIKGFHTPHDMKNSASDLIKFVQQYLRGRSPDVVCGHSLGGKVVLEYLRQVASPEPPETLESSGPPAIQLPIQDRQELLRSLKAQGFQENLVQWINSSLIPYPDNTDEFKWAFDIEGAAAMYHSYCRTDYWDLLASPPMGATVNVLRGGKSDRWDEAMIAKLDEGKCGKSVQHVLEGAGHWVHFDAADQLCNMFLASFQRVESASAMKS